jgi:hypothetical protein
MSLTKTAMDDTRAAAKLAHDRLVALGIPEQDTI